MPGECSSCPDGALHFVSLAALPVGAADYLIETGPVLHYLTAERDLVPGEASVQGRGLLALGAPAFDDPRLFAGLAPRPPAPPGGVVPPAAGAAGPRSQATYRGPRSACDAFTTMQFEPLPASAREAQEIAALWMQREAPEQGNAAGALTGAAASEEAFKQRAGGHRVLHLATHGFFLGGRCASATDVRPAGGSSSVTGENPLLLAGMALAGANHRQAADADEEDGILTAEEVAALDLGGVEWVVLSACDTGAGELKASEGVFGLRRAFQVAGARTTIMSLWQVEDAATRGWMRTLYRGRLVAKLSTADAVRKASLAMLRLRRADGPSTHPFYWAGFVAVGDWK